MFRAEFSFFPTSAFNIKIHSEYLELVQLHGWQKHNKKSAQQVTSSSLLIGKFLTPCLPTDSVIPLWIERKNTFANNI